MDEENLNNNDELVNNELPNDESINEEEIEDSNIVTLKDEMGNDVKFEFLDLIEYEGENYVILLPAEVVNDEEADEVVILKEDKEAINVDEGEESYMSVDDEEVLNKVFDIFKEKFKDEFNFVEDDNN